MAEQTGGGGSGGASTPGGQGGRGRGGPGGQAGRGRGAPGGGGRGGPGGGRSGGPGGGRGGPGGGRDGRRLTHFEKEYYSSLVLTSGTSSEYRQLEAKYISHLYNKLNFGYVKVVGDGLELILVSKISNSGKKIVGYVEQRLLLRQEFLQRRHGDRPEILRYSRTRIAATAIVT